MNKASFDDVRVNLVEVFDGCAVILEHGETWVGGDEFGYGRWQWWWW
jgi:hypothetical protein